MSIDWGIGEDVSCPVCGRSIVRPAGPYEIKLHISTWHKKMARADKKALLAAAQPQELTQSAHQIDFHSMTPSALMKFWAKYNRPSRKDAIALVGPRPKCTRVAQDLANYASNLATAKTCHQRGDVEAAEMYEKITDRIYDKLPSDLK